MTMHTTLNQWNVIDSDDTLGSGKTLREAIRAALKQQEKQR